MRLLCRLFTASEILWWTSAHTATTSSNRTKDALVSFSAVRLETNASDVLTHLQSYDSTAATIDYDQQSDEERSRIPAKLLRVSDAIEAAHLKQWIRNRTPVEYVLERLIQTQAGMVGGHLHLKLLTWLQYVKQFNSEVRVVGDDEIVKLLLTKFQSKEDLVRFFHSLRDKSGMIKRVDEWQRLLVAKHPETLELVVNLCLGSKMDPEKIYQLMPIAAKPRLTGDVSTKKEWRTVKAGLTSWLDYVVALNKYSRNSYDSTSVVTWLMKKRGVDEAMAIFHSFRDLPSMQKLADTWQKELAVMHPETVEKMIPMWQNSNMEPEDVYKMMPVAAQIRAHGIGERKKWPVIRRELRIWVKFSEGVLSKQLVESILSRGVHADFHPEQIVFEKLTISSKTEEIWAFLDNLAEEKGLKSFAQAVGRLLLARRPVEADTQRRIESWAMSGSGVSPEEVYFNMPIAMARQWKTWEDGTVDVPAGFNDDLTQFLQYVDKYRENGGEFDDGAIVKLICLHISAANLQAALELKRYGDGTMERANQLLRALRNAQVS